MEVAEGKPWGGFVAGRKDQSPARTRTTPQRPIFGRSGAKIVEGGRDIRENIFDSLPNNGPPVSDII